MTSGVDPEPDPLVKTAASTIADSGSPSIATVAAPMPTATAGVSANPGRCDAISPAAAPRNRAGNTGPPRKLPSEIPYATPLATIRSASAAIVQVPALETRGESALAPEKSTVSTG